MANRILITGGLGFMGHFLSRKLLGLFHDCELTIVDNLSSSHIDYRWLSQKAEIIIEDFKKAALVGRHFDRIYHLASPVGSIGILDRTGYVASEIVNLAVCAGECAARGHTPLLYVSSSEVYGKAGVQNESDVLAVAPMVGTRMEYAIGKLAGEHLLQDFARRYNFKLTICRPFNVLGEKQSSRSGFVVPSFYESSISGRSLLLFNGGWQKRCFCYVEDIVNGLIAIQEKGKPFEVYNLGSPENLISIRDLAVKIRTLCGSNSELESVDPSLLFGRDFIEAPDKIPDIMKVKQDTGWKPLFDLDTALYRVLQDYTVAGRGVADDSFQIR